MDQRTTITTAGGHDFRPGDWITFTVRDTRWWRRLLFWALRLGQPQRTIRRRVSQASQTDITF